MPARRQPKPGLTRLTVRARPGNPRKACLSPATLFSPARSGQGGISANKREGDGATPLASMRILSGYFRGIMSLRAARASDMTPISCRSRLVRGAATTATTTGR